jgi:hypothetical protein
MLKSLEIAIKPCRNSGNHGVKDCAHASGTPLDVLHWLIVSMGSFQLSQISVNAHYLALRTTVKKLVVSTALLFATVTANQAVACDMGAIETWVAAACQRNGCEIKSTTKNSAEGCDGSNCTALYSVARPELSRLLTAK